MLVEVLPLALLDAFGVSTLAVPIWFLLTPHGLRYRNVAGYLLLVAAGYLLLGLALLAGMSSAEQQIRDALASPAGDVTATVAAVALLALAAWHGLVQPRLKARRGPEPDGPGRLDRWREAAVGETGTWRGVLTVAAFDQALARLD